MEPKGFSPCPTSTTMLAEGRWPRSLMKASLAALFDQFISYSMHTRQLRSETIRGYTMAFKRFSALMPEVAGPADLTQDALDRYFSRLQDDARRPGAPGALKASTLRSYGSKLHSFFAWLVLRNHLSSNPIIMRDLPEPDYSDHRAFRRREIERILGAITQYARDPFLYRRDIAMVHVLLFCGLRKSELISLKVYDVDLEKMIIRVNGATSKSKRTRLIPIASTTATHLNDYLAARRQRRSASEALWVSSQTDQPFTLFGLKHWVTRLQKRSGVRCHLHRFRHSFACMLGRANVSAVKIQRLLGHTDLRMTQKYLRSMGVEDMRDSIQRLSLENL